MTSPDVSLPNMTCLGVPWLAWCLAWSGVITASDMSVCQLALWSDVLGHEILANGTMDLVCVYVCVCSALLCFAMIPLQVC